MSLSNAIHFHSHDTKGKQRAHVVHDRDSVWCRFEDDPTSTNAVYFFANREEFQAFAATVDKARDATCSIPRKGVDVGAMIEALERIRKLSNMSPTIEGAAFRLGEISCQAGTALDLAKKQGHK